MYVPCFLGEDCEASHRWAQAKACAPAGPFNTKGITTLRLIKFLEDNFQNLCLKENLKILDPVNGYEKSLFNCIRVAEIVEGKIGMELWHNFPKQIDFNVAYENFFNRMYSKIEELKNIILYDLRPIMFIHKKTILCTMENYIDIENQFRMLVSILKFLRNGKKFLLVGLGNSEIFAGNWEIENLQTFQIHTAEFWTNDNIAPEPVWLKLIQMCENRIVF